MDVLVLVFPTGYTGKTLLYQFWPGVWRWKGDPLVLVVRPSLANDGRKRTLPYGKGRRAAYAGHELKLTVRSLIGNIGVWLPLLASSESFFSFLFLKDWSRDSIVDRHIILPHYFGSHITVVVVSPVSSSLQSRPRPPRNLIGRDTFESK